MEDETAKVPKHVLTKDAIKAEKLGLDLEEISNRNLVYTYQNSFLYMLKSGKKPPDFNNSFIVRLQQHGLVEVSREGGHKYLPSEKAKRILSECRRCEV